MKRIRAIKDGYVKIRATCEDKQVEGWVKKVILTDSIMAKTSKVTESGGVSAAAMGPNASVGHSIPPQQDRRMDNDAAGIDWPGGRA